MASQEGREKGRAADAFANAFSAAANAAKGTVAATSNAAKGTASIALAHTYHATEIAAKGTVALGESTLHATGSSVSAMATTTRNYTGKFQSTFKQSMNLRARSMGPISHKSDRQEGTPVDVVQQDQVQQDQPTTPKPRSAAERRQDVRADHVIFDTSKEDGREALLREAAAAINANNKLRERLRLSDGTRAQELGDLLRQYQAHIGRYEGNILATVQGGAKGKERLDIAKYAASDMTDRLRHFSSSAALLAASVEKLRRLTRPLELAEAHIMASMGKLECLAVLVEHVRQLRDIALEPTDRALYFESAADLVEKCEKHWSQLISSRSEPPAAVGAPQSPSAKRCIATTPAQEAKAEAAFAAHPRLASVRKAMLDGREAVAHNCRAEFKTAQQLVSSGTGHLSTQPRQQAAAVVAPEVSGQDPAAAATAVANAGQGGGALADTWADAQRAESSALDERDAAAVRAAVRLFSPSVLHFDVPALAMRLYTSCSAACRVRMPAPM